MEEIVIRGRRLNKEDIQFIQEVVRAHWDRGRKFISQELCCLWDWRQRNGYLRDQVCRLLLIKLERMGLVELPPPKVARDPTKRSYYTHPLEPPGDFKPKPLRGKLRDFPPVSLKSVRRTPYEALWNYLVYEYHYQRYRLIVGEHLKYLAFIGDDPVACLAWGSPVYKLKARDSFIGWSVEKRRENLYFIANNIRFLILPWVSVRFLASHLLSLNIRRISRDWPTFYGHPLYLLESFIDRSRFSGTCYRASNWLYVGQTQGFAKKRHSDFHFHGQIKDIYLYPLVKDFRQFLLE